jgi:hypothetical protein
MAAVMLGHLPPAAVALMSVPAPALASLPWMGQSAVDGSVCRGWSRGYLRIRAIRCSCWKVFLLGACTKGELSQVYPIARGLALLLVTGISGALPGERLAQM